MRITIYLEEFLKEHCSKDGASKEQNLTAAERIGLK